MKKLYLITFLLTSLYAFNASAGPTGKKSFDPLINSYLTAVELSKDGNINAIKNREVIFSFLNKEQRFIVQNIYMNEEEIDYATILPNKIVKINFTERKHNKYPDLESIKTNKFIFF